MLKNTAVSFTPLRPGRILVAFVLLLTTSGCISWQAHQVKPGLQQVLRIGLLPIQVSANLDSLRNSVSSATATAPLSPAWTDAQRQSIRQTLAQGLHHQIADEAKIELINIDLTAAQYQQLTLSSPTAEKQSLLQKLRKQYQVQALLNIDVSGYGALKHKWVVYLIGSGVVEGLVQGVVVTQATHNTGLGVAVGLEEIAQEVLEWGGGSLLFNQHYAPVTLEANLYASSDGQRIWHKLVFVAIDKKAIKALDDSQQGNKTIQLRLTAQKALQKLGTGLIKAVERHTETHALS